jgi:nucleoside-diphosphate-sugar epimerase
VPRIWSVRRGLPERVLEGKKITNQEHLEPKRSSISRPGFMLGLVKPLPTEDLDHVLEHTRPLWEQARGRRIFISGGTGFFGAWLLETLAYCNRELKLDLYATVLTRSPSAFGRRFPYLADDRSIALLRGDVRDFPFPEHEFEYAIHGATSSASDAAARPTELMSTIVHGTERTLAFARSHNVQSFLFISSGAVYGRQPESLNQIPEDYLGSPAWLSPSAVYAEGKRIAEQMCAIAAKESAMQVAIARCFAFVGPHLPLDQHFAIGNFIADALGGRNITIRGDGTPMRSYLYSADLAVWLWTLLLTRSRKDENPAVINVGSGGAISIRDLAQQVVEELNPTLRVEVAREQVAGASRERYIPAIAKAETDFGLRPIIGLSDAIRRTANWYR